MAIYDIVVPIEEVEEPMQDSQFGIRKSNAYEKTIDYKHPHNIEVVIEESNSIVCGDQEQNKNVDKKLLNVEKEDMKFGFNIF